MGCLVWVGCFTGWMLDMVDFGFFFMLACPHWKPNDLHVMFLWGASEGFLWLFGVLFTYKVITVRGG
jgi:hypothetical protein